MTFSQLFHEELDKYLYHSEYVKRPTFCILGRKEWNSFIEMTNSMPSVQMSKEEIEKAPHKNPTYDAVQLLLSRQDSFIKFVE